MERCEHTKKRSVIRAFFAALILVVTLAGCGLNSGTDTVTTTPPAGGTGSSGNTGTVTGKKWTYMVYVAGDNNLASAAIADLKEMESVGSTDNVNVVVQIKFSKDQLDNAGMSSVASKVGNTIYRGKVSKNSVLVNDLQPAPGFTNMADKSTLTGFIKWAQQTYPADNYALVLWSHGGGWKTIPFSSSVVTRGAIADDSSNSFMSMPEIASAIKSSGVHFGEINFDACLMAMYEVAYSLKDVADYLVVSEEVIPGQGDDYNRVLTSLTVLPSQTARDVALMEVAKYKEFYAALGTHGKQSVTRSAIDLSKVGGLKSALDDLASYLTTNMSSLRAAIQTARNAPTTLSFDKSNRDLGLFLDALKKGTTNDTVLAAKIATAKSALAATVLKSDSYSPSNAPTNLSTVTGLSIFIPKEGEYLDTDLGNYRDLGATLDSAGWKWGTFLTQLLTGTSAPKTTTRGDFGFAITWDNPDVDLDLYVAEPLELASPWLGTTASNGFLSPDSADSGLQYEDYVAKSIVAAGVYDVFVNNFSGVATKVTLWYIDPTLSDWKVQWTKQMKTCSSVKDAFPEPFSQDYTDLQANTFCDWIYDPGVEVKNNKYDLSWWQAKSALEKAVLLPQTARKHRPVKHLKSGTAMTLVKNPPASLTYLGR